MYPQEYINYLVHFHGDRDFFECHEILEDYWKKVDKNNKDSILVAFILLAVSNYHHRRKNFSGAYKTMSKALAIFTKQKHELGSYGYCPDQFLRFINERLEEIHMLKDYKSTNLPIEDQQLLQLCKKACVQKGFTWGEKNDLFKDDIVHKHKTRDRSEVLSEREKALKLRNIKGRE